VIIIVSFRYNVSKTIKNQTAISFTIYMWRQLFFSVNTFGFIVFKSINKLIN